MGGARNSDAQEDEKKDDSQTCGEGEEKEESKVDGVDDILEELRKLRRQNTTTHRLLAALIVLTAFWQLSQVSLVLLARNVLTRKLRRLITSPFRLIARAVPRGIFRPPQNMSIAGSLREASATLLQVSPLPPVAVPEVWHDDLPTLALNGADNHSAE